VKIYMSGLLLVFSAKPPPHGNNEAIIRIITSQVPTLK
jgi:hypothetical protein